MTDGEPMAASNELPLSLPLRSLENRSATIILTAVRQLKTEQDIWKALRAAGIDVRKLPLRFVVTTIEDGLKSARLAANALKVPRKRKSL
jgi:hypothetical protein